jgi:hypothetical protein
MRLRSLLVPAVLALTMPMAGPASADPDCFMLNWHDGDSCTFEAPIGAFTFSGVASEYGSGQRIPWIAIQISLRGELIASCYDQGTLTEPAECHGTAPAGAPFLTHVCQVFGTSGPIVQCADPPPLPVAGPRRAHG